MQPGGEHRRRRREPGPVGLQQAVQVGPVPGARTAQGRQQRVEGRPHRAHPADQPEQVRPAAVPAHDGGQVGHRVAGAVLGRARRAQHPRGRLHGVELEGVRPGRRQGRVEEEGRHPVAVRRGVLLRDVRPVAHREHRPPLRLEHLPQVLEVGDRVVGAVEGARVAERRRAGPHRRRGRHEALPRRGLQRRAVQRRRPGAALVEGDQPVGGHHLRAEPLGDLRRERRTGRPRPAVEGEQHPARCLLLGLDGHLQRGGAAGRVAAVERDVERAAGEPATAGVRPLELVEATQRGRCRRRGGARRRGRGARAGGAGRPGAGAVEVVRAAAAAARDQGEQQDGGDAPTVRPPRMAPDPTRAPRTRPGPAGPAARLTPNRDPRPRPRARCRPDRGKDTRTAPNSPRSGCIDQLA